ncbi:hypothetical protein ABDK00_014680 [Niabella insulamsoli]|uniref:hypothetical protein n=1 Tax=Niabella insulamsoli TaxID=3144874 RepID=UPI0031FD0088
MLEVDSISLGFSRVYYKKQNSGSSLGFYPINVATVEAIYKLRNNKWIINNTHFEAIYRDKIVGRGSIDFLSLEFRDSAVNRFKYADVVQRSVEDNKIQKKSKEVNWKEYEKIISEQELRGVLTVVPPPEIDTTENKVQLTAKNKLSQYLMNNSLKREYGIHKFPVRMSENSKRIAEYGLGAGVSFRLYRSIFIKGFASSNFGISNVSLRRRSLNLSNEIIFNKKNRAIIIALGTGISTTKVKEKSLGQSMKFYTWESDIYLLFERTKKSNFFTTFSFYSPLRTFERSPFATFTNYSFGIGYIFD